MVQTFQGKLVALTGYMIRATKYDVRVVPIPMPQVSTRKLKTHCQPLHGPAALWSGLLWQKNKKNHGLRAVP